MHLHKPQAGPAGETVLPFQYKQRGFAFAMGWGKFRRIGQQRVQVGWGVEWPAELRYADFMRGLRR